MNYFIFLLTFVFENIQGPIGDRKQSSPGQPIVSFRYIAHRKCSHLRTYFGKGMLTSPPYHTTQVLFHNVQAQLDTINPAHQHLILTKQHYKYTTKYNMCKITNTSAFLFVQLNNRNHTKVVLIYAAWFQIL